MTWDPNVIEQSVKLTNNGGDLSGQIACIHRHGELVALQWKVPMD